jgi:hypothetical protein
MLIGNGMLIDKVPLSRLGQHWNNFVQDSSIPIRSTGLGKTCAVPDGYYAPQAMMMPIKAGAVSSYKKAALTVTGSGAGAMGVNGEGVATLTIDLPDAAGQLVVSGNGTASFSVTAEGNVLAALLGTGAISFQVDGGTTNITAKAWAEGTGTMVVTCGLTSYARGHMTGSIVPYTELSPQSLADAVWQRVIETGFTAEEVVRILASVAAGDATGLEGSNPVFRDLNDTKDRITATYAGGTREVTAVDAT